MNSFSVYIYIYIQNSVLCLRLNYMYIPFFLAKIFMLIKFFQSKKFKEIISAFKKSSQLPRIVDPYSLETIVSIAMGL